MTRLKKKQINAILDLVGRWAHTMAGTDPFDLDRVKAILDPVYQRTKVNHSVRTTTGRGKNKRVSIKWKARKLAAPKYICLDSPMALRIAAAVVRGRLTKQDAVVVAAAFGISPDFVKPLRRDKMIPLGGDTSWRHDSSQFYSAWHNTIMPYLKAAQLAVFYPSPESDSGKINRNNKDERAIAKKLLPAIAARKLPAQSGNDDSYNLEHNNIIAISGAFAGSSVRGQSAQFGHFYCNNSLDSAVKQFAGVPWTASCRSALWSRCEEADFDTTYATTILDAELLLNELGITDAAQTWKHELMHAVPLCMTFQNTVLLCGTRPTLKRNADGELHCADGPAVAWPDGSGQYYLDGHALGNLGYKIVVAPEQLTLEELNAEPNEEVKRLAIEKYGWGKYLDQIGATVVDRRENWVDNTIEALVAIRTRIPVPQQVYNPTTRQYEQQTTHIEQRKLILACRSTGRQYFLAVPENTQTCEDGQRWMAEGANTHTLTALSLPVRLVGAS
jgi:hypothetical protein